MCVPGANQTFTCVPFSAPCYASPCKKAGSSCSVDKTTQVPVCTAPVAQKGYRFFDLSKGSKAANASCVTKGANIGRLNLAALEKLGYTNFIEADTPSMNCSSMALAPYIAVGSRGNVAITPQLGCFTHRSQMMPGFCLNPVDK